MSSLRITPGVYRHTPIFLPTPGVLVPVAAEPIVYGTRFYLPSSGAAAVSPSFSADWEDTSIAARLATVTTKIGSAATQVDFGDSSSANRDILFRQYVSAGLAVQTITAQIVEIQIRAKQVLFTSNMFLSWGVKAVSNDGTTLRGTLVAVHRDDLALAMILTNREDFATSTPVTLQDGDRLVFEIGTGGIPLTDHDSSLSIGDDQGGSDLPHDDVTTTVADPWIQFSQAIAFQTFGRTTKNTDARPLGQFAGISRRMHFDL